VTNARAIRDAIVKTLPEETSLFGAAPEPRFVHVPASHAKALHPDVQVVKGMRGAGKSFWWAALQDRAIRRLVAQRTPSLRWFEQANIHVGFGEKSDPGRYPGRDVLQDLLYQDHDARLIWKTVVLHALGAPWLESVSSWQKRIDAVVERSEEVERFLFEQDDSLHQRDEVAIVVFDALDRSASDWDTMNRLVRGLLQTALDLRPYRRLRIKCFLRTDQIEERTVATFPDASKVLSSALELTWPVTELYAMFFQYLGNASDGVFREYVEQHGHLKWRQIEGLWLADDALVRNEETQRKFFHEITGEWMGRDRRRGDPYRWVPGHLADGAGRTSPRSFLAALHTAAEDSGRRYPDHERALHYESIKRGVQQASRIRQRELQEDVPWVDALLSPLQGQVVPCAFEDVAARWKESRVVDRLGGSDEQGRLPPAHLSEGLDGLRADLEALGVFVRMNDGRVNIPDLFRVAYGIGRRGGVKPLRREEG